MKKLLTVVLLILPVLVTAQQAGYSKSTIVESRAGRDFYLHKVTKGQTLYAISKLYETNLDTIVFYNPSIKEGLKTGTEIIIPLVIKRIPGVTGVKDTVLTVKAVADTIRPTAKLLKCDSGYHAGPFEVALMMPFYLDEAEYIPADYADENNNGPEYKSFRFVQFYEAALMALDSVANLGATVNLHVYDVDEDTNSIKKLLKSQELKQMDLIIGLLYGSSFQKLSAFASTNKVPVVNPLSNRLKHIENNPYVFLANCSVTTMAEQIAGFLGKKYFDNVIILFNSGKENEKRSMKIIYDDLIQNFKESGNPTQNIFMFSGVSELQKIKTILTDTDKNAIVVLSNDELFVANIMRYLKEWSLTRPLMVFGMPGWIEFKSVESKLLVDLNYHSFSTSFIDYYDANTKSFISKFREQYKSEPQELAFQGFDVTYYFLTSMMKYGKDFVACSPHYEHKGLQTRYKFRQKENSGFENTWLNIYRIKDYQVINASD